MTDDLVAGLRDTDDLFFFRCADEIERLRRQLSVAANKMAEAAKLWAAVEAERDALLEAACGLGVIGDGYCFCSRDRDPHRHYHEPECRDLRAAIDAAIAATSPTRDPAA